MPCAKGQIVLIRERGAEMRTASVAASVMADLEWEEVWNSLNLEE